MKGFLLLSIFLPIHFLYAQADGVSHPPLRGLVHPAKMREVVEEAKYVSPGGSDVNPGTKEKPFGTLGHGVSQLAPGETLYLRGGVYFENVRIALQGLRNKPVTVSGFPGEEAVLDGSYRQFQEDPAGAWELGGGGNGEYRSTRRYPNIRNILGSFGDSMVGLQTYYHAMDLRADREVFEYEDWGRRQETDLKPVYLGPGLWYNPDSSQIHIRLGHTNLPDPVPNYRGETDPRKFPMVLAPYHSVPLTLGGAKHVRIRDLTIRGGGYTTVQLEQASHIEFDNLTIWAGTYGFRASGLQHFKMVDCGVYGNVAPWTFRADGSKRDYPGRPHRNLSRLNTHASFEIGSGRESSVHAFPQNDHWEIAHCEFTDAHDGPYIGGINVDFHHNLIDNLHDDGLYLSPMYKRHRLEDKDPAIHIRQNFFRRLLTPLAFGGPWPETRDQIRIYRNVFDLRHPVPTGRPSSHVPEARYSTGKLMGDHGSPPWPAMDIYHNTVLTGNNQRHAASGTFGGLRSGNTRRIFNNLFLHQGRLGILAPPKPIGEFAADGNLYWTLQSPAPSEERFFGKFRAANLGCGKQSLLADPKLRNLLKGVPGFRLDQDSPAIGSGVGISADWPDPYRHGKGKPDIGALPAHLEMYSYGRR